MNASDANAIVGAENVKRGAGENRRAGELREISALNLGSLLGHCNLL